MILYHEIGKDSLSSALEKGLKRTARGGKSAELYILKTDEILDQYIPLSLKKAGLSRKNNLYAYIGDETSLIDIRTGETTLLNEYIAKNKTELLKILIDSSNCYVSNLDIYDKIKTILKAHESLPEALMHAYWRAIIPLEKFKKNQVARPEIIITCDVPPDNIAVLSH